MTHPYQHKVVGMNETIRVYICIILILESEYFIYCLINVRI